MKTSLIIRGDKMKCYIYFIINQLTNERYVGQTTNFSRRKNEHFEKLKENRHPNPKLQNAYNKYGKENFSIEKITFENLSKEELNKQIEAFGNCNVKEYKIFYNLLKNWNKEIINSFIIVDGRRINNSHIESINRQIDRLMYNANGYINFKRARNRIMYCINKKDTYKM